MPATAAVCVTNRARRSRRNDARTDALAAWSARRLASPRRAHCARGGHTGTEDAHADRRNVEPREPVPARRGLGRRAPAGLRGQARRRSRPRSTAWRPTCSPFRRSVTPRRCEDLRGRLAGDWHVELSPDADRRGIRVGFISRLPLSDVEHVRAFPPGTAPVQLDDDGATLTQMGRGALRVRVDRRRPPVDFVTCHLKSKLLQLSRRALQPARRGRARALRRLRARAARRRGDHAARLRHRAAGRPRPAARRDRARRPQRRAAGRHHPDPARPARLGDRHAWLRPRRCWRRAAAVEPRAAHPPEDRRFSRIYNGRPELIDHILVSHALVHDIDFATTGTADLPSVTMDPGEWRDATGVGPCAGDRALRHRVAGIAGVAVARFDLGGAAPRG